jgi:hypothetical protein
MRHNITGVVALLCLAHATPAHCHVTVPKPPPGYRAYHATMYGNEHTRGARNISSRHTASGLPFRANARAFAMDGAVNQKFKVWTPGHAPVVASCVDCGAGHPDLAYGFFREMYYNTPSRHMSYERAGTMTIWMKRISGHVDSPTWRAKHKRRR